MSVLFLRNAQDNKHLPSFLFRGNLSKNSLLISLEHTSSDDEAHASLRKGKEEALSLRFCSFTSDDESIFREKKEYTPTDKTSTFPKHLGRQKRSIYDAMRDDD